MAYSYEDIMQSQFQNIATAQAQAAADLEAARHAEDPDGVSAAADRILALDLQRNALSVRAQSYTASQHAQPQGNRWGLNEDEVAIATGHPDDRLTTEEKLNMFANNKQRYRQDKASGLRRDDQGMVRR